MNWKRQIIWGVIMGIIFGVTFAYLGLFLLDREKPAPIVRDIIKPGKIYKGTYDGKVFEIKEYQQNG